MVNHPARDSWPVNNPWGSFPSESFRRTLPSSTMGADDDEESSRLTQARRAARPSEISSMAAFGAVLSMGALGAGALFLLHALVSGNPSNGPSPGAAEMQGTGATITAQTQTVQIPAAQPPAIPLRPATPPPSATASAAAVIQTPRPKPSATLTAARPVATAAPASHPRPKGVPRWRLYPFPVPTPANVSPPGSPPSQETSSANPYAEPPSATSARPVPSSHKPVDVPSEDPFGF